MLLYNYMRACASPAPVMWACVNLHTPHVRPPYLIRAFIAARVITKPVSERTSQRSRWSYHEFLYLSWR